MDGFEWTELLPGNERIAASSEIYGRWYDGIIDYILG